MIILQMAIPVQVFANDKPTDGEEVDIHACGVFKIIADLPEDETSNVCRIDDRRNDGKFKTKDAAVDVHISQAVLNHAKSGRQILDQVLLNMIHELVQKKIDSFAWVHAVENEKNVNPDVAKTISEVKEKYAEFVKEVMTDEGKGPQHEIRKLLTLYPDIEAQILELNPSFRPLICRYELRKHRIKILQGFAKGLAIAASIAILAGGPATAYFWIPALPKILMIAGGVESLTGVLKIGTAIAKWDDVRAASTAKTLLAFYKDNDELLKKLQKDPTRNAAMIAYLQDHRPSPSELDRLKDIKKLKRKEIAHLLGGLLNTAFGAAAIYGGVWAGKQFSDFKATTPAHVTDPYTPPNGGGSNPGGSVPGGDDGG